MRSRILKYNGVRCDFLLINEFFIENFHPELRRLIARMLKFVSKKKIIQI